MLCVAGAFGLVDVRQVWMPPTHRSAEPLSKEAKKLLRSASDGFKEHGTAATLDAASWRLRDEESRAQQIIWIRPSPCPSNSLVDEGFRASPFRDLRM